MKGDFSKWDFDGKKNFSGVLHQQGRVLLDTDWNAQTRITNNWQDQAGRDAIGPGVAAIPASEPNSFKVQGALVNPSNMVELRITPGRVWADGLLTYCPGEEPDPTADIKRTATYLQSPIQDTSYEESTIDANVRDAVILEVWREAINGFQMPHELIETALGGPDTTERLHTAMAFRLLRLEEGDTCENIREKLKDDLSKRGKLKVTLQPVTEIDGECPVVEGGGYTGFEHCLYRIEMAQVNNGSSPMFKWSQFNGGLVGRGKFDSVAKKVAITANLQPIITSGMDTFYLEAVEHNEELGHWQVTYGAEATLNSDNEIELSGTTFGTIPASDKAVFFRLWNGIKEISAFPENPSDPESNELRDGIRLEFEDPSTASYIPGDYWTFSLRAGEIKNKEVLIGEEVSGTIVGEPPEGIHYYRVPLAILNWDADKNISYQEEQIHDCRKIFHPLTDLHGLQGCCTVTVGDGSHSQGDFNDIQKAINYLLATGGQVCILPGIYTENVLIEGVKENITIRGCGEHSKIISETPSEESGTANPVIHVKNSQKIRIESLSVSADNTGVGILLEGSPREITLADLHISAATRSAIEVHDSQFIAIRECRIHMSDVSGIWPGIFFVGNDALIENNVIKVQPDQKVDGTAGGSALASAGLGGLQLGGNSERVRVINNLIQGGIGNGITLGSVDANGVPGNSLDLVTIRENIIKEAGLNGIGVQRFFAPSGGEQPLITIDNLVIEENLIVNCANQASTIEEHLLKVKGYGGIALADGEHITIRDNEIRDNGATNDNAPVTGIFLYHGVGIEISGNRIEGNGKDIPIGLLALTADQRKGYRGGIVIPYSTALFDFSLNPFQPLEALALTVRDNIVISRSGPALSAACNGKALIANNTFYSEGMNAPGPYLITSAGATVSVIHLGSNIFGLLVMMLLLWESSRLLMGSEETGTAVGSQELSLIPVAEVMFQLADHFNSDGIIFEGNRCNLELGNTQMLELVFFSIFLFSYSDIIYHGNQNSIRTFVVDEYLLNMLLFSLTHVVSGNSFREGYSFTEFLRFFSEFGKQLPPKISYMTIGAQSVVTSNNSTNCYVCMALPNRRKVANNVMTSKVCEKYGNLTFKSEG